MRGADDPMDRELTISSPAVHRDPEILGGTPVFKGTRVPLRNLFEYLQHGHTLDEFLDAFPSVSREDVLAVLDTAREALTAGAQRAHPAG